MKHFRLLALTLVPFLPLHAVEEGARLDEVVAEKGDPSSRMQLGDTLVLNYSDEMIKIREGKVISIKSIKDESGVRTLTTAAPGEWTTSYRSALAQAKLEKRRVLLFFTGSDWCGYCKRLEGEVLSTSVFQSYAQKKLILVKLDFPRKTFQSPQEKQQNLQLQKQYEVGGYPTVIVLDSEGNVLGQMGYRPGGARSYVSNLKDF